MHVSNYKLPQHLNNKIDVTILFLEVPSAPRSFEVQEITPSGVTLTWEVPDSDGGLPVTSYIVERRDKKFGPFTKIATIKAPSTSCMVERLIEGVDYYFKVTAVNDEGSGPSAELSQPIRLEKQPGNGLS